MFYKVYGASLFDKSLSSKDYKLQAEWVDKHHNDIINFRSNEFISKVKNNKVGFLAFCFEYVKLAEWLNQDINTPFKTYLPIQLDATCNGYPHFAMMTNEKVVLPSLNIGPTSYNELPKDFYGLILDKAINTLQNRANDLRNNRPRSKVELKIIMKLLDF